MPIALPAWSDQNSTFVGLKGRTSGWGNIDDSNEFYLFTQETAEYTKLV